MCTSKKHQLMLLYLSAELQAPLYENMSFQFKHMDVHSEDMVTPRHGVTRERSVFVINSGLRLFLWESSLGILL